MDNLPIINMLQGGDRRSVGRSSDVAALMTRKPERLEELLQCAIGPTAIIRSRATHALMQLAQQDPAMLEPHANFLLDEVIGLKQWETRAHVCQTLTRLPLNGRQIEKFLIFLQQFLEDKSSIVKTCAMQALVDLCSLDPELYPMVHPIIAACTNDGTAAMRARGRQLLKVLDRHFPPNGNGAQK